VQRPFLLVAIAGSISGCLPFAVPPARVESGIGTRLFDREEPGGTSAATPTGVLRAGFHPTQLFDSAENRRWDVGLGYRLEWRLHEQTPPLQGPYAELGFYPLRLAVGRGTRFRWGSYTSADAVLRDGAGFGPGATLGTLIELSGTTSGTFSNADDQGGVAGAAFGQWAFGMFANTSLRAIDDRVSQSMTAGMSLRVPFAAGVACCFWPSLASSASKKSVARRSQDPPARRRRYRVARPRIRPIP
jgi:hypothetical protein